MSNWSINNVIKDIDDGNIKLDFYQDNYTSRPTTDDDICKILTKDDLNLSKVTWINLTFCSLITDEALKLIGEKCSRLEILQVGHCERSVTDESICAVLQTNPNIIDLRFAGCKKVTVATIRAVIKYVPNITELNANEVGLSVLPDDIQFETLTKLKRFYLKDNGLKKLPKSMATLPHDCIIYIRGNPLKLPPIEMANENEYGDQTMTPATIRSAHKKCRLCSLYLPFVCI